jgi:hypothetical protein
VGPNELQSSFQYLDRTPGIALFTKDFIVVDLRKRIHMAEFGTSTHRTDFDVGDVLKSFQQAVKLWTAMYPNESEPQRTVPEDEKETDSPQLASNAIEKGNEESNRVSKTAAHVERGVIGAYNMPSMKPESRFAGFESPAQPTPPVDRSRIAMRRASTFRYEESKDSTTTATMRSTNEGDARQRIRNRNSDMLKPAMQTSVAAMFSAPDDIGVFKPWRTFISAGQARDVHANAVHRLEEARLERGESKLQLFMIRYRSAY